MKWQIRPPTRHFTCKVSIISWSAAQNDDFISENELRVVLCWFSGIRIQCKIHTMPNVCFSGLVPWAWLSVGNFQHYKQHVNLSFACPVTGVLQNIFSKIWFKSTQKHVFTEGFCILHNVLQLLTWFEILSDDFFIQVLAWIRVPYHKVEPTCGPPYTSVWHPFLNKPLYFESLYLRACSATGLVSTECVQEKLHYCGSCGKPYASLINLHDLGLFTRPFALCTGRTP